MFGLFNRLWAYGEALHDGRSMQRRKLLTLGSQEVKLRMRKGWILIYEAFKGIPQQPNFFPSQALSLKDSDIFQEYHREEEKISTQGLWGILIQTMASATGGRKALSRKLNLRNGSTDLVYKMLRIRSFSDFKNTGCGILTCTE